MQMLKKGLAAVELHTKNAMYCACTGGGAHTRGKKYSRKSRQRVSLYTAETMSGMQRSSDQLAHVITQCRPHPLLCCRNSLCADSALLTNSSAVRSL